MLGHHRSVRSGGLTLVALAACCALAACEGSSEDGSDTSQTQEQAATKKEGGAAEATPPKEPEPEPSRRTELETWRPLLDETPRAELRARGLIVDLGTVESHKYTRGIWLNGWGAPETAKDGTTYADIFSGNVDIDFTSAPGDPPPAEVVMRIKACDKARVTARLDGEPIGNADLTSEWILARIPFSEAPELEVKPHSISVQVRGNCPGKARAQLDWIWLAEEAGAEPPKLVERQQPLNLGGAPRRALMAPDDRTYSYYMQVPEDAELVFDHAAKGKKTFKVTVTPDGAGRQELISAEAGKEWQEASVDLHEYAGQVVRLDLEAIGDGEAGWGEIELMVPPRDKPEIASTEPAKNVVIILIDTIRADVFEPIGGQDSKVDTPEFDELTKEATVFTAAYDNENWTKPSVATVLSGLYPVTHDAKQQDDVLDRKVELLSQQLKAEGFKTGAFIANGYVSDKFGFKKGWDGWRNYIREGRSSRAEHVYDDAIAWLEENKDDRFFLYVQTIDPHVPYRFHEETTPGYAGDYNGKLNKILTGKEQADLSGDHQKLNAADYDFIRALYYGEVTYHDQHMGRLLEKLRSWGLMEDTLLIITNDHGEELDDHGKMGHGHSLYDELVRAPLLIRLPGRVPAGQVLSEPVESVDIAPTVLQVLGMNSSKDHEGVSLVSLMEGRPAQRPFYAVTEFLKAGRSVRVGTWKMIGTSSRWKRLYNVAEDPGEQKNLIEDAPLARRMCELHMTEALANPNKRFRQLKARTGRTFKSEDVEMDPELKKQLEALGYFHED